MRELSKVFQGVILASRDRFRKDVEEPKYSGDITSSEGYLVALWRHECERVFCDKLTNDADKTWTEAVIMELVKDTFGPAITAQVERRVQFVDFLREPTLDPETGEIIAPAERCYEAIDLEALRIVVDAKQKAHNEQSRGQKFELVLFDAALEHLCRISRLLASDRGSALLVGVGGSGKQSLTRLAAYLAGAVPFQITITKQYNQVALFDDIKIMYKMAGFKGQKVAFIFTDAEARALAASPLFACRAAAASVRVLTRAAVCGCAHAGEGRGLPGVPQPDPHDGRRGRPVRARRAGRHRVGHPADHEARVARAGGHVRQPVQLLHGASCAPASALHAACRA
jgi:hypothetical protein